MVQLLYYGLGMVWIYYTYYAFGAYLFKPGEIPDWGSMLEQMKVMRRVGWQRWRGEATSNGAVRRGRAAMHKTRGRGALLCAAGGGGSWATL